MGPTLQETRTVPIIFVSISDPVGGGFVDSLARPGGNATGFLSHEYSFSAKWLELLKEIAPGVARAAVLQNPRQSGSSQFAAIQAVGPALRVEVRPLNGRDGAEIDRVISNFAHSANSGLIVAGNATFSAHRDLIVKLANRMSAGGTTLRPMHAGGVLAGAAVTVKTRPGDNLMVHKAFDIASPGDVIVVDAGGDVTNAIIGENAAPYAESLGRAGVVTNGAIRGSAAIAARKFPIFAIGITHRGPHKDGPGEVQRTDLHRWNGDRAGRPELGDGGLRAPRAGGGSLCRRPRQTQKG